MKTIYYFHKESERQGKDIFMSILTGDLYTHEDLDYLGSFEEKIKVPSFYELVRDFPTAKETIRRLHKKRMKEIDIAIIRAEIDEDDNLIKALKEEFKKLGFQLSYLEEDKEVMRGVITEKDIEQAKQIPISNFIRVNRAKKAICLFHSDKDPSMHIYNTNRYYCFVCGASGSSIDIVMKLYNCSFKEAVQKLLLNI